MKKKVVGKKKGVKLFFGEFSMLGNLIVLVCSGLVLGIFSYSLFNHFDYTIQNSQLFVLMIGILYLVSSVSNLPEPNKQEKLFGQYLSSRMMVFMMLGVAYTVIPYMLRWVV